MKNILEIIFKNHNNKIILLFMVPFLFINSLYADFNEYKLTNIDYKIISNAETKVNSIIVKNDKYSYIDIINLLKDFSKNKNNIRLKQIINTLINSLKIKENKVTILEGWSIFDIDQYLSNRKLIKKGDYILYVENRNKIISLGEFFPFLEKQKTLEGYLYPDTYEIDSNNFKINNFVIKQLEAFENKVYNKLFLDINKKEKYNNAIIESIINLASIVEKEEKNKLEKPIIAGILKKRVKEFWNLGADITTCYSYRLTSEECKLVISKYINIKSEYNTRFIIGLPPTPIGNPSFETINSTLNHKKTKYYYYLHNVNTGKVYYAETNNEHNRNKELEIAEEKSINTIYENISSKNGIKLFQSKNKDISIIDVDLNKAGVSFGGLIKDGNFRHKYYSQDFLQKLKENKKIFAAINGQFFLDVESSRTGLSFPIKSEGIYESKNINIDYINNNIPKRTLIIDKDDNVIIHEGYNEKYLINNYYKELIVAFTPEVSARKNDKIGRSYIGLKCSDTICKNIIFFIAEDKNQKDMDKIVSDYGVKRKNIIMMDGGPSAQFSYLGEKKTFYGKWKVPQFNIIYEK